MKRTGQRLLSIFLLLPILTILAHNSIPHHHHASQVETCCGDSRSPHASGHLFASSGHSAEGHHDACSFNPEFTFDLFKILIAYAGAGPVQVVCPLKWIEPESPGCFADDALCKPHSPTNLLRGPPAAA